MNRLKQFLSLASVLLFTVNSFGEDAKPPKVLLIGIDGIQHRMIDQVKAPVLQSLNTTKAYCGGKVGEDSEQITISGPGWTTILTGKWAKDHGVQNNDIKWRSKADTVFKLIRESRPEAYTASIVAWDKIHTAFINEQLKYIDFVAEIDDRKDDPLPVAIEQIRDKGPDLIFVDFLRTDSVGHKFGYGPEYNEAIEIIDGQIGKLKEAVDERAKTHNEDWLILITTDHGRRLDDGKPHGQQTLSEKTIFIKMNKEGNEAFNQAMIDFADLTVEGLYQYPPQTAIVPTILDHLQIDLKKEWGLDSGSLLP